MSTTTRIFEYKDDKSAKFWEVSLADKVVTVRYGKTGTAGQTKSKELEDAAAATAHVQKLIREKTGKGYVEQGMVNTDPQSKPASLSGTNQSKPIKAKVKKILKPHHDLQGSSESKLDPNYSKYSIDHLEPKLRMSINAILSEEKSALIRAALLNYSKISTPYALPSFSKINRRLSDHRRSDMIGGYPYTSTLHPWPRWAEDGIPMQPIVQIDLRRASEMLGTDFGNGIAQVWTRVMLCEDQFDSIRMAIMGDYEGGILLRVISESEFMEEPLDDYPEYAPWINMEKSEAGRPGLIFRPLTEMNESPIVHWSKAGQMFDYVDLNTPLDFYVGKVVLHEDLEDSADLFLRFREIANSEFPGPMSHTSNLFLGGCGGATGADDPAFRQKLLFNIQDSNEMNISIVFDESEWVRPTVLQENNSQIICFHRERKLKAFLSLPGKNW